eukprot:360311-Chlamydomonas_euryale.AAC.9
MPTVHACCRNMHATDACMLVMHACCRDMHAGHTCMPPMHACWGCMHAADTCMSPIHACRRYAHESNPCMPPTHGCVHGPGVPLSPSFLSFTSLVPTMPSPPPAPAGLSLPAPPSWQPLQGLLHLQPHVHQMMRQKGQACRHFHLPPPPCPPRKGPSQPASPPLHTHPLACAQVIPLPHVRQVLLPPRGARLLIASDGVWDVLTPSRAAKLARELSPSEAATELVRIAASNLYGVVDDTSAIVVDLAPSETPMLSGKALPPLPWEPRGWSLLACLKPSSDEPDSRDVGPSDPGHLLLLSDIDALHAYPQLLRRIDSHYGQRTAPVSQEAPADFTMHGSRNSGSRGGSTHGPGESGVRTSNPLADFVARLSHRERSNSSAAKGPPSSG